MQCQAVALRRLMLTPLATDPFWDWDIASGIATSEKQAFLAPMT